MWTTEKIPDQSGKTAIVTGANTGIGYETALALYQKGAHVILAGRDANKLDNALQRIRQTSGMGSLETGMVDLSSLQSVRHFANEVTAQHNKLDMLINNAGVMMSPASKTVEGFELQFGTNFIGHFALTGLLFPVLRNAANARIVTVSSLAYLSGRIDFDNLRSENSYDPVREYAQSKLADLIFALELQRRLAANAESVVSLAAQPGANKTELARHMSEEAYQAALERFGQLMEPWQGALPSLYAATAPEAEAGALYGPHDGGVRGYPAKDNPQANALDAEVTARLWALAEETTGVKFP